MPLKPGKERGYIPHRRERGCRTWIDLRRSQHAILVPHYPSSSLAEGIIHWLPQLRETEDGMSTCAVVQAEDELAAAGMVLGAGWAGGRGMTCTSGPGISLMSEFIGLAYFAEVPGVIWDVNRVGPSTGLPTRTQQGDLNLLREASHGDTEHIVLIPGTVEECFEFGWRAFDYAERFQTLVFRFLRPRSGNE